MRQKLKAILSILLLTGLVSAYACYYPTTTSCATAGQWLYGCGGWYPPGCSTPTSVQVVWPGWKASYTTSNTGSQGYSSLCWNASNPCRNIYVRIYNNCTHAYDYIYINDTCTSSSTYTGGSYVPNACSTACL